MLSMACRVKKRALEVIMVYLKNVEIMDFAVYCRFSENPTLFGSRCLHPVYFFAMLATGLQLSISFVNHAKSCVLKLAKNSALSELLTSY